MLEKEGRVEKKSVFMPTFWPAKSRVIIFIFRWGVQAAKICAPQNGNPRFGKSCTQHCTIFAITKGGGGVKLKRWDLISCYPRRRDENRIAMLYLVIFLIAIRVQDWIHRMLSVAILTLWEWIQTGPLGQPGGGRGTFAIFPSTQASIPRPAQGTRSHSGHPRIAPNPTKSGKVWPQPGPSLSGWGKAWAATAPFICTASWPVDGGDRAQCRDGVFGVCDRSLNVPKALNFQRLIAQPSTELFIFLSPSTSLDLKWCNS